jgi:hypothetical protein
MAYKIDNFFDYLSLLNSNIFYGCINLNKITFESVYEESVNITNNITFLGESIFENCLKIVDVYYEPNPSVNYVPKNMFKNCISLDSIDLSDNIIIISKSSFENCGSLTDIVFPRELQILESDCFKNCIQLNTITIYDKVNLINTTSFQNCDSLLISNNSIVFHDNNSYVISYFSTLFSTVKIYDLTSESIFTKFNKSVANLLNIDELEAKKYTYNAIVLLTGNGSIVSVENLISQSIDPLKIPMFRNLVLKFIFDSNSPYYDNFIIKSKSILLPIPNSTDTTYVHVYKEGAKNINVSNNYNLNINVIGTYCLLSYITSECKLNDYKLHCYVTEDKYYITYSNDNFVTSQNIISEKNKEDILTNYTILGGELKDLIFYKNYSFNFMNLYLDSLQINITSGLSLPKLGEITESMTADAWASIDIPLSIIKNTFLYWSDSINVDDLIPEGVKFKTVNYNGWSNINLTDATVYEGAISYYKKPNTIQKKQIKYDFIRYLSLKIFKSANGADLFRNNEAVTKSLDEASNIALRNKLNQLELLGEFDDEASQYNVARVIFRQILSSDPKRIVLNDVGEWNKMPLYVGDKIYLKLIINPHTDQHTILANNIVPIIDKRSYLVDLNIISG